MIFKIPLFLIGPTIELTGVQKQSEATLLHVRVERIVRGYGFTFH